MPEVGLVKSIEGNQARILTSNDSYTITLKKSQEGIFWENEKVDVTVIGSKVVIEKKANIERNNAIKETSEFLEDCIEEAKDLVARVNWDEAFSSTKADQEKEIDLTFRIATTIFINAKRSRY